MRLAGGGRWLVWSGVVAAVAAFSLFAPPSASAFDTSPHFDITGDALSAEGFNRDAVRVAQVNNWFNDLYVNAKDVPKRLTCKERLPPLGLGPTWRMTPKAVSCRGLPP